MVNVEIDARILEDKKFNTQVENIITETREARRNVQIGGAQLKSSPVYPVDGRRQPFAFLHPFRVPEDSQQGKPTTTRATRCSSEHCF